MPKKIKNPERYIHKLKAEIVRLKIWREDERRRTRQYAGSCMVSWSVGALDTEECHSQHLGSFRVGDYVAVVGKVKEVHEQEGKSLIRFRRIQTKKVEAI